MPTLGSQTMFVRSIGRWAMMGLVMNTIIGASIYGLPDELTRLLGTASPFAMIVSALIMAIIITCGAEVASQFTAPGGSYLYVRTAYGRFAGMQVAWFHLLAAIGGTSACANLFVNYLAVLVPWTSNNWARSVTITILIANPAVANYVGVRSGVSFSSVLTIAKLTPLVLLILVGLAHFVRHPEVRQAAEAGTPPLSSWVSAMVLLLFAFGGWEDALVPAGEIQDPRKTVPFGLGAGLLASAALYALLQLVVVRTVGVAVSERPVAETASKLLGGSGAVFVAIAVMISTYGWISAAMLSVPRMAYSLAVQNDFPKLFASLHPRFRTPHIAISFFAMMACVLAISGTFLWIVTLSSGSMMVLYAAICASLIRLRKLRPNANAMRVPFGPLLSILGVGISVSLLTGLRRRELLLMFVVGLGAAANWLWARRHIVESEARVEGAAG